MATQRVKLRIFVSSPGDVAEERVVTHRVLNRLIRRFAGIVEIEAIFWEHEPLLSSASFQAQIPRPSETDIVVTILWARLGTRLPREITRPDGSTYQSGTEFEFEDALEGRRLRGTPDLIVYRKQAEPVVSLRNEEELLERLRQKQALDQFFERWFHGEDGTLVAAFHPFTDSGQFEELVELHLGKLVERWVKQHGIEVDDEQQLAASAPRWDGSPYRGLDVFEMEHAPIFFGRTKATGDVLDALRRQAALGRAFLLVLGASGSGKSSLIRAGVLPMLREPNVIEGVGLWRWAVLRPSDSSGDLFDAISVALLREEALPELAADGTEAAELAQMLRENPAGANMLLKGALSQAAAELKADSAAKVQPEARLAFVVDQFEELFTLDHVTAEQRAGFVAVLGSLARSGRIWVIATLRSDYYDRCGELPELVDLKSGGGQIDLLPPTAAEIGQMIRKPAQAARLRFEENPETHERLDEVLRDAAAAEPASLPLLEFTLDELFKARTSRGVLTHAVYQQLGGVEGALANQADRVFAALDEPVRQALPRLFRMLVSLRGAESDAPTRRTARLEEVRAMSETAQLVDAFVAARLLTAGQADDGVATIRVAHEALLTRWPPLVAWLESDHEQLLVRGRLAAAVARWREEAQRGDLLLSAGKPLDEANLLVASDFDLTPDEREFIAASNARARRASQIKAAAVVALVALAILASISGLVARRNAQQAQQSAREAQENADEAERQTLVAKKESAEADLQRLAAEKQQQKAQEQQRRAERQRDRAESQLYAANIAHADREWHDGDAGKVAFVLEQCPPELRGWEHDYLYTQIHSRQTIVGETDRSGQPPLSYLTMAVSPDDQWVAAATSSEYDSQLKKRKRSVDVYQTTSRKKVLSIEQGGSPLLFSPDNRRLLVSVDDDSKSALYRKYQLYEIDGGKPVVTFESSDIMRNVVFSRDGKRMLGVDKEKSSVVEWDAMSGKVIRKLDAQDLGVLYSTHVAYGRDDESIIRVFHNKSIEDESVFVLQEVDKKPLELSLRANNLTAVAFSPDKSQMSGSSEEGTTFVWDTKSGAMLNMLRGHVDVVNATAFSPDGKRLATVGSDPFVKVWDLATGRDVMTLVGHDRDFVNDVAFSSDGKQIISCGSDGTLRQWDAVRPQGPLVLEGHETTIRAVAFSRDDKRLVSGDESGVLRLWSVASGEEIRTLWDLDKWAPGEKLVSRCSLPVLRNRPFDLHFNENSDRIISLDAEETLCVHRVVDGVQMFEQEGINCVAVDKHGNRFVSGGLDGVLRVWDSTKNDERVTPLHIPKKLYEETHTLTGHQDKIWFVAFHPDGKSITSCSADGTYKTWDLASGKHVTTQAFSERITGEMLFTADGPRLINANWELYENGEMELWDLLSGRKILDFQGHWGGMAKLSLSPDGRRLATCGYYGDIKISDIATGIVMYSFEAHVSADPEYPASVFCVRFSHDGRLLASGGMDKKVKIWNGGLKMPGR